MHPFTAIFIATNIIVTVAVLLIVFRRMRVSVQVTQGTSPIALSIEAIRVLTDFAKTQHERIGNYMQANWSGMPDQLPGVLGRLLDSLQADAQAKGITVERDTLKVVLATSLRTHKIGKRGEVSEALAKVA